MPPRDGAAIRSGAYEGIYFGGLSGRRTDNDLKHWFETLV